MTIWIDTEAFVEALNRSSVWGWSTEQDETAHKWVFGEIEKFLNDNQQPNGDLISRQDAITSIKEEYFPSVDDYGEGYNEALNKAIWILEKWLPSAETSTASEKHQLSEETSTNTSTDLISRQDAIKNAHLPVIDDAGYEVVRVDDILGLPSAPDSRQRGEWVPVMDKWGAHFVCSQCGAWKFHVYQDFCGLCGADMRGEEE